MQWWVMLTSRGKEPCFPQGLCKVRTKWSPESLTVGFGWRALIRTRNWVKFFFLFLIFFSLSPMSCAWSDGPGPGYTPFENTFALCRTWRNHSGVLGERRGSWASAVPMWSRPQGDLRLCLLWSSKEHAFAWMSSEPSCHGCMSVGLGSWSGNFVLHISTFAVTLTAELEPRPGIEQILDKYGSLAQL